MARNLSVNAYFRAVAAKHTPKFRFCGSTKKDWQKWHDALYPAVKATLGRMPKKVPLNPEIQAEWESDGVIKQRIIFDVEEDLSAVAYIFRPADAKGRIPGILASHGHGQFGKDAVMGHPAAATGTHALDTHYGLQMAKNGFAVVSIDWRRFGERDDRQKPNWNDMAGGRDFCNLHYIRASILGMTVLGMDVHDGSRALDLLCAQDYVDPKRLGIMGCSFGGTMTLWMTLIDERIKAADIMCFSDRFADFGMRDINFCGSQVTPGLYELCDVPDLQGLIAPRPLLVEIGAFDTCFMVDSAISCYREVEKIYSAAGVRDKLELDLYEGEHGWGANKSLAFFRKYLG